MKHLLLSAALLAPISSPALAQSEENGLSLMEKGAQLFLEGFLKEAEPALKELQDFAGELEPAMRDFAESMGPALADLLGEVQDWSSYHPPEILPNGDIILRKKTPAEPQLNNEGEIEL